MTAARWWRRSDAWAVVVASVLLAGFIVAFGARQAIVLSSAMNDDGLFISLGRSLAAGRWLGGYNELTLTKGPGFPAFLAVANVTGLPFPLALSMFYAACAGFAAFVAGRVTGSRWTGIALLAALLLTPLLADGEMMRVSRDVFYGALVVALAAAMIALSTNVFRRSWKLAAATGVLGAWAWLTREEGVWLLPLGLIFLIPLIGAAKNRRALLVSLRPAAIVCAVATATITSFGLLNWAVYGRFVVNEVKDGAFQSAMGALQEASAPYHKTGIPVPAAARARIYPQSPAFAEVREPILDGAAQAIAAQPGCLENKAMCGDLGGGWFQWSLRTSASLKGHHANASEAARYYRELAGQVRAACKDGRLTCQRWLVPLVPPMTSDEIDDVARSFGRVADVVTFGVPVVPRQRPSDLAGPGAGLMTQFLNLPAAQDHIRLVGWYRGDGASWFSLAPSPGVEILDLQRLDSPDVAGVLSDPRLGRQRFVLEVRCPAGPSCLVNLTPDGAAARPLDLANVVRGRNLVAGVELFFDNPGDDKASPLLKEHLSRAWTQAVASLNPVFRGLIVVGAGAYLAMLFVAARRRALPAPLVICTALLLAVAARSLILALIDALSFRATSHAYVLPASLLLVMFSLYAIHAALALRGPKP